MFDMNIAYDVNGGSLHVVSDAAAGLIGARSEDGRAFDAGIVCEMERRYGADDVREAAEEINSLIAGGQLFTPEEPAPGPAELENAYVFKSLCMHLAHDCNMKCAYCFASEGNFGQKRELMSYETACAAIDFISAASNGRTNIEIDFFGGEPLLNYDVLKRVVEYAGKNESVTGKKYHFTLTTNGLLLNDDVIDYVNARMDNLVLSIDGRKQVNDAMRKCLDGSGTYDQITEKFMAVTKKREKSWYVRGTYTVKNKDFSNDVLHLADLGFKHLSIEPVVSPMDPSLGFEKDDADDLFSEYEKLVYAIYERRFTGNPVDFFHFNIDLDSGPCLARRIKGCGAGYEYTAVTPDGGLYPCHQFAGIESFRLGDVFNGVNGRGIDSAFKKTNIYTKNECRNCWAKYFCGGGCAANAWFYNKDIEKPNGFYCALFRKRIECALWLKCAPFVRKTGAAIV
jgi:uncharacterized protein